MNILFFLFFFFLSICSYAQQKTFYLGVGLEYNDNIYLRSKHKESDLITYISPGIRYEKLFEKSFFSLRYNPIWTIYYSHPESNTLRQDLFIRSYRYLTRHLKFSTTNHYIKSEEPIEKIGKTIAQAVRGERNVYERNKLDTNIEWKYNKYSLIKLGCLYEFLDNTNPVYEDSTKIQIYVKSKYWPVIKWGIDIDFSYIENRTSREIGETYMPDFNSYDLRVCYTRRFNKRLQIKFGYYVSKRSFLERDIKDRHVKEYSVGVVYKKSPFTNIAFNLSKFRAYGIGLDRSFTGYEFNLIKKVKKRSTMLFSLKKGWDVGYLEARRRGFTRYTNISITYVKALSRTVQLSQGFYYRKNHYYYFFPPEDKTYIFRTSLKKIINPNLSITLSYTYEKKTSPMPSYYAYNYVYNSIMFSFQYIFQWK